MVSVQFPGTRRCLGNCGMADRDWSWRAMAVEQHDGVGGQVSDVVEILLQYSARHIIAEQDSRRHAARRTHVGTKKIDANIRLNWRRTTGHYGHMGGSAQNTIPSGAD